MTKGIEGVGWVVPKSRFPSAHHSLIVEKVSKKWVAAGPKARFFVRFLVRIAMTTQGVGRPRTSLAFYPPPISVPPYFFFGNEAHKEPKQKRSLGRFSELSQHALKFVTV